MKYSTMALALTVALAGCASQATRDQLQVQDPTVRENGFSASQNAAAGAVTETWNDTHPERVSHAQLDSEQQRLQALGAKQQNYFGAKAQCWIYAAREERNQYNEWGFVEEASREADQLIDGLEGRGALPAANPVLRTATIVRPDLWRRLEAAKNSPVFGACPRAQRIVACSEVALIHAGHEAWSRLFEASQLRVADAAQQIGTLDTALAACTPPSPASVVPAKVVLPSDTLFQFDRGDIGGMLEQGRASLDALARDIVAAVDITAIRADGYTDRLGSERYNRDLSKRRAQTVVDYLRSRGVTNVQMSAVGRGSAGPVAQCGDRNANRAALIECLAPDRRVELSVSRAPSNTDGAPSAR
ncbi:OmpA family protein [Paraburkholderia acidisoli]|uniref:OmpA family protein n=1 Tax=Paraburkholderia acidisoli TaxID=2571748 RepID=A0A7Z2JHL1_9BURK|nr:OmpA family protein [Paraburkholderia acidisoli]QGZ64193.1 OmpA family protein [Paraburkholderia acidisoli]